MCVSGSISQTFGGGKNCWKENNELPTGLISNNPTLRHVHSWSSWGILCVDKSPELSVDMSESHDCGTDEDKKKGAHDFGDLIHVLKATICILMGLVHALDISTKHLMSK